MAVARKFNTSFLGGEVCDRFMARIDSVLYDKTLRILENFIIHPTGGLDFDPGTVFICEAKTNTGPVRLLPLEKSSSDKYVLELTEQACRFYKDKARILDGANPLEIVTPWLGADLAGLQTAQQENRLYLAHRLYQLHRITNFEELAWVSGSADIDVSLAVGHVTTPFVTMYSYNQDSFSKRANPNTLPTYQVEATAFSTDGSYLAVGQINVAPILRIYKRSGDTYQHLVDPVDQPGVTAPGCCFSNDSKYLAVASSSSPWILIYKRNGDSFTKIADPADLPGSAANRCAFSKDGTYLAVAVASSPWIVIYKRNGDVFAKLANPADLPLSSGTGCCFSPNNKYLAVTCTNSPYIVIYKRDGDVFNKLSNPSSLPNGGRQCAFSSDSLYLAVAHNASPYILIYKRSGDTFVKLADPAAGPAAGVSCAFSAGDTYLAVVCGTTPYLTIYKRSGDSFAKLANPANLPAGAAKDCAFVADGWEVVPWASSFPRALTFHDQRLIVGRDQTVYGSHSGWPQNFNIDAADESAGFEYSLAGDTLEEIIWMRTKAHNIVVGTTLGEWLLTGGDAPITGSNIYADRASGHGSAEICAVLANESLLYVQKGGQRLREFMYSLERGGYVSPDLTMLADHIGELGFAELAWQRSPCSMLWIPQPAGGLASVTLDRNNNIVAWGRHPRGGLVKSMAIVSGDATNGEDTIYLCVQRQINGVTKQYIEYMTPQRRPADPTDYHFVDCGKIYDFSATQDLIEAAGSHPNMVNGNCEAAAAPHVEGDGSSLSNCTFARTNEQAFEGAYSFKQTKSGAGHAIAYFVDNVLTTDLHELTPGKTYRITARTRVPSVGGPSSLSEVILQIAYYNAGAWSFFNSNSPAAYDSWQSILIEKTIPPTATAATLSAIITTTAAAGEYCYWDKIQLQSDPVRIDATGHPFADDELVRISGVVGMTELNGNVYMVKSAAADAFELYLEDGVTPLSDIGFEDYVSGGLLEKVAKELTGLDHLEGETVAVYADGEELGQEVVSSGEITIDAYAAKIHVGLPYQGKMWTQRLGRFSPVRVPEATLLLYKSRGGKIGSDAGNLMPIRYAGSSELTGPQEVRIGGRFSKEGSIMIVQDQPLPMTILGIVGDMSVGE